MIAITSIRAKCLKCGRIHGKYPWEKSFWVARGLAAGITDGGPVFEAPIPCGRCKDRGKT